MRKIAEIIESIQTSSYDPNSSDPTHTQIAKDHDDHPFHVIAADLAMEAVRQIGEVIMRYWNWSPSAAGDIGSVLFPSEKYRYTDLVLAEKNKLDDFIKEIESHAQDGDTIHLIGQSSADGRAEYNLRLSEQRALTVGDYLRYKIKNVKLNFTFEAVGESGAAYGPEWRSTKIQLLSTAVPVNPAEFAAGFLVNPVDTNWMDEMVRTWAKENSRAIEQVRSKTKQLERPKAIKDKAEPLMEKNNQSAENMMKWVNTAEKVFGIFISPKEQN
jgi:outer membrane protein OmpA-like peptidoglycan-associated protein